MLKLFERRPGLLHAVLTGFRPAWKSFAGITRGRRHWPSSSVRTLLAQRALHAMDR